MHANVHEDIRILLVEDNRINQSVAIRLLEHLGQEVDLAVNGSQALSMIRDQIYDLILMDVQMPEMDGLEVTQRIRHDDSLDMQPYIIGVSAAAMLEEQEACINAGMDAFVSKPLRIHGLAEAIEQFLTVREGAPDS